MNTSHFTTAQRKDEETSHCMACYHFVKAKITLSVMRDTDFTVDISRFGMTRRISAAAKTTTGVLELDDFSRGRRIIVQRKLAVLHEEGGRCALFLTLHFFMQCHCYFHV